MEDEKLADKLLDRILMVLMPYDQIDVERVKAKLTVVLDDYQISPKQEALAVYTEGKNDYYLRKFLLAKAVAGRQERTLRQYKDEVGRALRGIGKDADTITADDIQVYLAKVLSRGGSKCYCDNIRRDLSSFYNWLYREEIIRTNPMNKIDNIKFKREKEKALTDMEIEMMRQACQTTMQKAIMEMLLSTGCRAAELVSIKIADMDEDKVSILGKGGKWRTVYINAKAFVAIKNYLADRKDTNPYLFPREINTKDRTMISNFSRKDWFKDPRLVTKADHFGRDSVNNMVRTIGKRAGVKGVHTHRFRRTCATQVWGNYTGCYPSSTDPKDMFIPCGRMFAYVQNTIIRTCWQFLDKPMNRRLLDTITDTVNIWLNGLVGSGYLLGARVEIREDENPVTQLMAGIIKIHVYMTPASPAQEIDFVLEYDSSYVTSALTA